MLSSFLRRRLLWPKALGLWCAAVTVAAAAGSYVVVSATATDGYERQDESGALRPESYIISKGTHFGHTRDAQDADEQFNLVLQALAPALAEQEYWPANGIENADLLIVVHWGETEVYEDPVGDYLAESYNDALAEYMANADEAGNADPGRLNELKRMEGMSQQLAAQSRRENAELLGFQRSLEKEEQRYFASVDEQTMKAELAENRYFVVLMAWDYAALRQKQPAKLMWVTRMSVRAPGNRFVETVPALMRQGGPLFGRQSDDLVRRRESIDSRNAEVEIGDTEVVEEAADETRSAPAP
ncbi:hypothetical protein [Actomonas aquatica]|uniref:Uncharacterized protein n=1 Tax=Actomonas aquatica TaxID=2866162 RepID=A0ABZ1C6Z9_9BACT|nr:hypothetical protein [Opitutus sp. WL0086]WRQ87291.1 hypothetical protein K1X11_020960 [Opitutus sp. WL0086]